MSTSPNPRSSRKSPVSISQFRWTAYVAAGTASAAACAPSADADIFFVNVNQTFNAAASSTIVNTFALTPGNSFGLLHARFSSGTGVAKFGIFGAVNGAFAGFSATNGFAYVARLNFGDTISAAGFNATQNVGTMAFGPGYGNDQWLAAGTGYIGFRFDGGAGTQYGWIRITMLEGAPGNSFQITGYAWADVGESITAGQIPEPGSLALLAVGGVGLLAWRRRRAQAALAA